jgi:ketosteroid isomerase-like protein
MAFLLIPLACLLPWLVSAQQKPAAPPAPAATNTQKPEAVVDEWFRRWNALDGSEAALQSFLELYQPNAVHEVGPSGKQIGPVYFESRESIRKMAEDYAKANTESAYHVETVTANEVSSKLYYVTQGPWGGPAVSVQFVGAYTVRETKKRYFYPGAAFFHIQNGKIRYARFYSTRDELAEVRP